MSRGSSRSWKDRLGQDKLVIEPVAPGAPPLPSIARKLARLLVAMSVAAILFCGYFPFDFNFSGGAGQIARRFDSTLMQQATAGDSFENILFFMPFGFALGAVLRRRWLAYWVGTALAAMVLSAALSTLVEFGQAFLSMRDPSLTDIVNNSIGGLIGFGVYRLVGDVLLRAVARAIEVAEQKMGALMLAVVGALYSAIVCIVPIFLGADAARLGTWNPNYHLAIGDEFGGQRRSWDGTIGELHLATKAADRDQLAALFEGADPATLFGDKLIASYTFRGDPPFEDRMAKNPPLELGGTSHFAPAQPPAPSTASTKPLSSTRRAAFSPASQPFATMYDRWLRTPEPVSRLNRAIANAHEFTAILTCASARPDQAQVARIFSISQDIFHRNFTVGQDGTKLVVRVRNQVNGQNGAAPEFVLDDVFTDSTPHKIILTYADARLSVYLDGLRWKASARITPEAATIWWLFPRGFWSFSLTGDDVSVDAYVYRGIVFLPLGALAAAMANQTRKRHRERAIIAATMVGATIVLMEALLTTMGGQRFNLGGVLLSAICGAIGIMIVKIRRGDRGGAWALK